ncbi:MliC family protein [Marinobacter daepoensis]|uniref:MliC family protein n=1 Tax=Marinobacter daepoensis TaxID=262077 RepID=UPI001FCF8405|nr:MliC family protein [Marinobacter daepoensis]
MLSKADFKVGAMAARLGLLVFLVAAAGCANLSGGSPEPELSANGLCSEAWYEAIEHRVPTGDGQGHGPDIGSDEWKSVIEFRLGIRGQAGVPARDTDAWCRYIESLVQDSATGETSRVEAVSQPSFSCEGVEAGSTEAMICANQRLSALDRELSGVYAAALEKAENQHPSVLRAEQRGWIKGRDDCWKADDRSECVAREYQQRIAELQARYQLVPSKGPFRFACDGNPANEVIVTFFETEPSTLVAERGDRVSLMYLQPSASGSKYQGRNEMFWEHQGQATIVWGHDAPDMQCVRVR